MDELDVDDEVRIHLRRFATEGVDGDVDAAIAYFRALATEKQ